MSQADELLNSFTNETLATFEDEMFPEPHIVINANRSVSVPEELKRIAVQYDHDVETVTFDCPRYWDEHDMSEMGVYINYKRADGIYGCYEAQNISVDPDDSTIMHFTWTVSHNVTLVAGKLAFIVCTKRLTDEGQYVPHWHSELCEQMYVAEGLETSQTVLGPYPDILTQWYRQNKAFMQTVINNFTAEKDVLLAEVEKTNNDLLAAKDAGEFNGATFTPAVSPEGVLSWTNDKGFENPNPLNLAMETTTMDIGEGYQITLTTLGGTSTFILHHGASPVASFTEIEGGYTVSITDAAGTKSVDLMHGVSPTFEVEETTTGHVVRMTDAEGIHEFTVLNGGTEAMEQYMKNYFVVGETEPSSNPVIWFDTTMGVE